LHDARTSVSAPRISVPRSPRGDCMPRCTPKFSWSGSVPYNESSGGNGIATCDSEKKLRGYSTSSGRVTALAAPAACERSVARGSPAELPITVTR